MSNGNEKLQILNVNAKPFIPGRKPAANQPPVVSSQDNNKKEAFKTLDQTRNYNSNTVVENSSQKNEFRRLLVPEKAPEQKPQVTPVQNNKVSSFQVDENKNLKSVFENKSSKQIEESKKKEEIILVEKPIFKQEPENKKKEEEKNPPIVKPQERVEVKVEEKTPLIAKNQERVEVNPIPKVKQEEKAKDQVQSKDNAVSTKVVFSVHLLRRFKENSSCRETKLIESFLPHHEHMLKNFYDEINSKASISRKTVEKVPDIEIYRSKTDSIVSSHKDENFHRKDNSIPSIHSQAQVHTPQHNNQMHPMGVGHFARKNLDENTKIAQEYKEKIQCHLKKDPITDDLKEQLNKLTLDNYDIIKEAVFSIIAPETSYQEKLIEVLFKKAIIEKNYVIIYAKLCYELDKELPQKIENVDSGKRTTSYFRGKLLEKCKNIFKDDLENMVKYIVAEDEDEREHKIKQFILGRELINNKLLSKNVVFHCIDFLKGKPTHINLEGIVILIDKFGTFINKPDYKMKKDNLSMLNSKIDSYLADLIRVEKERKDLPGHIRYRIINLSEKQKNGWIETKVDMSQKIKTKQEVGEEFEAEQREKGNSYYLSNSSFSQPENEVVKPTVIKDSDETIKSKLQEDFQSFCEYLEYNSDISEYEWHIIDSLLKNNTIASLIKNFADIIVDDAGKPEDVDICHNYVKYIFETYSKETLKDKALKTELIQVIAEILVNLHDFIVDNYFLIDIWGTIIYEGLESGLIVFKDFEKLKDLNEDQLKCIGEVITKAILNFDENKHSQYFEESIKIPIFSSNKNLYREIWNIHRSLNKI